MDLLVKPGETVLDIGANWGLYSWRLARIVGPKGRVHSFEPDPSALRVLHKIGSAYSNIRIHPVAISDQGGDAHLNVPCFQQERLSALASICPRTQYPAVTYESVNVSTERLDSILAGEQQNISFIKCDVEGHEQQVLEGAQRILRSMQPSILIEIEQRHRADGSVTETFSYLLKLGYKGFALFGDKLKPIEDFDLKRHQLSFVRDEFVPYSMPSGYVHDFLFVNPAHEVKPLLTER
jgi:FkbM family methyltransferase